MKKIILFLTFIFLGLFLKAQQPYDYYAPIMTDSLAVDSNVYIKNVGIRDALFIQYSVDSLLWSNEKVDGWKYYRFSNDLKQNWSRAIGLTTSTQLDSVDYIDFSRIEPPLHRSYRMFADTANSTIAFYNEVTGVSMQIGLEQWTKVWNESGATTLNGKVVYVDGAEGKYPTIQLADNRNFLTASSILGVVTHDIENNTFGFVTNSGEVRDLNTSSYPEGSILYLGEDGGITHVRPVHPNFIIEVGRCLHSDATEGKILVNIKGQVTDVIHNAFNSNFIESVSFVVSSDGSTITGTLQRKGGGDLTMLFNDGFTNLDCTPPQTITLTPGTSTSPLTNYVYIPKSTKELTISTSDWPVEPHIRVAEVAVRTAALTQSDGVLKNQVWNDHLSSDDGSGHIQHLNIRVRRLPADWYSGVEPSLDIQSVPNPDNVYFSVTGGKVFQMHLQDFPAQSLPTNDIHIVNHPVSPFLTISNLNSLLIDANNTSLSGRSFSFVIWGVQNETDQTSHLMLNLPGGSYISSGDAINDISNFSNYNIPVQFRGVGFLIARVTMSHSASDSGTWTLNQLQDLRGLYPNTTAGGGSGGGGGGGSETFLGLLDTPISYAGSSDKIVNVNFGETGLVFSNITTSQLTTTINNSHSPVTLGTANGLSLNTQQLSLETASGSTTGALTSTDWNTFNNKEPLITNKGTAFNKSYGLANPSSLGVPNVGFKDSLARVDHIHPMPTIEVLGLVSVSSKSINDILQWNGTNWVNKSLLNAGIQPSLTTGNLTESITGLEFSATRQVIGGASELRLTTGYSIPTDLQINDWNIAYGERLSSASFAGTTTKTLTLTKSNTETLQAQFDDNDTKYGISSQVVTGGANLRLSGNDNTTDDVSILGSGTVTVTRTDENTITVSASSDNTDAQTISTNNTPGNVSISNGNTITLNVNDADYDPINEIQQIDTFRIVNNVVELSLSQDGEAKKIIDLSSYVNESPQMLSLINNSLSISQGNSVDLSGYVNTDSQNLGLGVRTGTEQPITISGGSGVVINVADNDNDSINEIQTLALTGVQPTISLSKKDDFGGGDIIVKGAGAASVSYEGDTLTINAVSGEVINAFTATIPIISTEMSVTYPTPFPSTNYFLNFNVYYDKVIGGKNVRVDNAIYDYSKTAAGFTFKVDTVAGYVELFASDTVNVYPFEYSETDPTVPSHVKSITGTNITNWNTAYGWGNHASVGYITTESDPTVSSYTKGLTSDTNVLNAVKNVDGTGSGLDADLLDGQHGSYYATSTHDHSGVYQPLDGDLTAIAGLSGTSGLVKKTAADTYQLDTNTYLTGNQTVALSGAVTGSGTTSISTTLSDNTATYAKIGTDLKSSNTVSSTVNLSSGGIGKITLSANTAFTFTNFELNKTYLLVVTANNYTASFAQSAKHVLVEGNATIGTTGVYYISLTCIDATSGSEKLLTVIMKGA